MRLLKQSSTAQPLVFLLVASSDHIAGLTGATPTVKLGKNGGAGAAPAGAVTEIDSTNLPGWYKVAGNATDTATLGPLILHATAASADPVDVEFEVVAFDPQSATNLGLSGVPTANPGASNGALIAGSNAATTFAALTVTGDFTISGSTQFQDFGIEGQTDVHSIEFIGSVHIDQQLQIDGGIITNQASANSPAISLTGNGTGPAILLQGGATAPAIKWVGGTTSGEGLLITTTSGDGIKVTPTAGNAITATANGTSKHGIVATGGTGGTSDGVKAVAGTGGVGVRGIGAADFVGSAPSGFFTFQPAASGAASPADIAALQTHGDANWEGTDPATVAAAVAAAILIDASKKIHTTDTGVIVDGGTVDNVTNAVTVDTGDGTIPIDENTIALDGTSLLVTVFDEPVPGVRISVWLKSEYTANPVSPNIVPKGRTVSNDDGTWRSKIFLDPGSYIVTARVPSSGTEIPKEIEVGV